MTQRTDATLRNSVYAARLDGLVPGTTYAYRVHTGASISSTYQLVTDRDAGRFAFTVWGDSQGGWPVFTQNVQAMRDLPIEPELGASGSGRR